VQEPTGTLEAAVAQALRLLEESPALAAEQAQEILRVVPGHPPAVLLLAAAHRRSGRPGAALELVQPLARQQSQ